MSIATARKVLDCGSVFSKPVSGMEVENGRRQKRGGERSYNPDQNDPGNSDHNHRDAGIAIQSPAHQPLQWHFFIL